VHIMALYLVRGVVVHPEPQIIEADEDQLWQIKAAARCNPDFVIEPYNPRPHSLAHRSIVSHQPAAFVRGQIKS